MGCNTADQFLAIVSHQIHSARYTDTVVINDAHHGVQHFRQRGILSQFIEHQVVQSKRVVVRNQFFLSGLTGNGLLMQLGHVGGKTDQGQRLIR
ncbi:hypothetical protein D3C77_271090 [compost metagenome]